MDEPVGPYEIGEDLLAVRSDPFGTELDALVTEAERSRPELQVLGKNTEALRKGVKAERAGYYPRLDAFGDALYANPNPRFFPPTDAFNGTWQVGARISYSIHGAIQTRQRIKELKAQERSLSAQLEGLRRGVEMEVAQAWAELRNARAGIELARIAREASEAAYKATVAQFRAGKATVTDLITAQGEQVSAQLQFVNAHIDTRVAETKLRYAAGRDDGGSPS
jgi:outer membrane protein TolC